MVTLLGHLVNQLHHQSQKAKELSQPKKSSGPKHRGTYRENPHWKHHECDPNGTWCMVGIRSVRITPYILFEINCDSENSISISSPNSGVMPLDGD